MNQNTAWSALQDHIAFIGKQDLRDMFYNDPERYSKFSIKCGGLILDYSKNHVSDTTVQLLKELAEKDGLPQKIEAMFRGDKINTSENRAVLHTALRQQDDKPVMVNGEDIIVQIRAAQAKMVAFCRQIHNGQLCGASNKKFTDILCLGIGGSFLGPKVVVEALKQHHCKRQKLHFVANVDGCHLYDVISTLNAETTLVIIASKSFSTEETMLNARTTRRWLMDEGVGSKGINQHMVAISGNVQAAMAFGIGTDYIFPMWDWVGGRYSLWSTIGLPIALAIGSENFQRMLAGACEMDEHFQTAPIEVNMPIIMALLGIWNINFWGSTSHCIIPYCHYLRGLPAHIQQLDMESNGKSISVDGKPLDYLTGPAIWGSEGVNSQHAFFQQIHQSNSLYPVDFIVPLRVERSYSRHHDMLVANCFAQSQAMMRGKSEKEAYIELSEAGYDPAQCEKLAPHKAMSGNKPNNVLMLSELSPKNVGALIALYEHKVVAQGMLWNINSFDQWGVELGKQLSKPVSLCIGSGEIDSRLDCSTAALIKQYLDRKKTNE